MTRHHWHEKTGDMLILEDHEETPAGYIDTHPDQLKLRGNVEPNAPGQGPKQSFRPKDVPIKDQTSGEPGDKPLTREEVIKGITAGGMNYNPKSPTPALDKLLHAALAEVMVERGLQNVDQMSTRQMMVAMEIIE